MKKYDNKYTLAESVLEITSNRAPDFSNLLKVLKRQKPSRPTLFEFSLNEDLHEILTGYVPSKDNFALTSEWRMKAFRNAGYDFFTVTSPPTFKFQTSKHERKKSMSLNETVIIYDRKSFDEYPWPDMNNVDLSYLDYLKDVLIPGMKAIPYSPGGILENTTQLLGYDNMCYLLCDDPALLRDVFDRVGEILYDYYDKLVDHEVIGAAIVNDDWGFNTQTMLSKASMLEYVVPWHKKFVERIHASNKPAIMHSCGQLQSIMDEIIDEIKFDGKHSYEDNITPVEEAYDKWGSRIAILGGIDVNFVCTCNPEDIFNRATSMLNRASTNGGYALGTGNSVPYYVPKENYFAMIMAALVNS